MGTLIKQQTSSEQLHRRRKIGMVFAWILYIIIAVDLAVVGYMIRHDLFVMRDALLLLLTPVLLVALILSVVIKSTKELKDRGEL